MNDPAPEYNLGKIRELLVTAFTVEGLQRLFLYTDNTELKRLMNEFSPTDSLETLVQRVITLSEKRGLLPDLLAEVRRKRPRPYAQFEAELLQPCEPPPGPPGLRLGARIQAPPLPTHFVPRRDVSDALKASLLLEEETAPGVLVISAIQGLPGIGKSVLAMALAHDPEVQAHFPDGVLWVTLGQRPELHNLLMKWIFDGLQDHSYRPTTVEAASARLRTLLVDKAALLVVDDVWNPEHAKWFLVGGHRCRVLITTRQADVAEDDDVKAQLYQMDVMRPVQSLALLEARLGRPLQGEERQDAARLAHEVGHLPLALELAATRVARGISWTDLCAALQTEVARLEELDSARRRRRKRISRLEAAFNLSLDALRAEDEEAWQAFAWLGVLPEDVTIAAPMVATLWDLDQADAADLLELLWSDALLLPGSPTQIGERRWPGYRLHDLVHDIARRLLVAEPPQGLGYTLQQAHSMLLAHYRERAQRGLWHTLPDDGYLHAHLTWHMEKAGQSEALLGLLREETTAGNSGWYQVCERLGQVAGYLTDVGRAWDWADAQSAVDLPYRYALITASLNSMAGNISPVLLSELVAANIWTPVQGFVSACQIPDPQQRAEALLQLLPHLSPEDQAAALDQAMDAARRIRWPANRLEVLKRLLPCLPPGKKSEAGHRARAAARALSAPFQRGPALIELVPLLPEEDIEDLIDTLLATAEALPWIGDSTSVLEEAARQLPPELAARVWRKALSMAQSAEDNGSRLRILLRLTASLPLPLQDEAIEGVTKAAQAAAWDSGLPPALASLASYLAQQGHLAEALEAIQGMEESLQYSLWPSVMFAGPGVGNVTEMRSRQIEILVGLASQVAGSGVLDLLLEVARGIEDGWQQADVLVRLAPGQPEQFRHRAQTIAQQIQPEVAQLWALVALSPELPADQKSQRLKAVVRTLPQHSSLSGLARHLAELGHFEEALDTIWALHLDPVHRNGVLAELACRLAGLQLTGEVQNIIDVLGRRWEGDAALLSLSRWLAESGYLEEAWAAAAAMDAPWQRTEAIAALSSWSTEEGHPEGVYIDATAYEPGWDLEQGSDEQDEWLADIDLAEEADTHSLVQDDLWDEEEEDDFWPAPWQSPEELAAELLEAGAPEDAWAMAQRIEDGARRAQVLAALAPLMPEELKEQALLEALATSRVIDDGRQRRETLAELTSWLSSAPSVQPAEPQPYGRQDAAHASSPLASSPEDALRSAQAIDDGWERARVLATLAPHLDARLFDGALDAAQGIREMGARARALADLAPHLPAPLHERALRICCQIDGAKSRAWALAALVPCLDREPKEQATREALAAVREIGEVRDRTAMLRELAPRLTDLPEVHLDAIWRQTLHVLASRSRRDLLADLQASKAVLLATGANAAVAEILQGIKDVGRWWP